MSRKIADLTPDTQRMAYAFLANCQEADLDLIVTCTLRSFEEQDQLYAQGRTVPGAIITKAKGGESPHNYGLAFDIVPIVNGKAVWHTDNPIWTALGAIGQSVGLDWGGAWAGFKDRPHFQRPKWREHIGYAVLP